MEYSKHGIRGMRGKTSCVKLKWSGVFLYVFEQKKRFLYWIKRRIHAELGG